MPSAQERQAPTTTFERVLVHLAWWFLISKVSLLGRCSNRDQPQSAIHTLIAHHVLDHVPL
jgi:hypothetical protein